MAIGRQWIARSNLAASTYGPGGQLGDQPLLSILPGGPATNQIANPAGLTDSKGNAVTCTRASTKYCRKSLVSDPANIQPNYETTASGSGASVSANQIAPDGTSSANLMTDSGGVGFHGVSATPVVLATGTYTASVHIKYSNCRYVSLIYGNTGSGCSFDVLNGTVAGQDGGYTGAIAPAGNGYYRVSVTHAVLSGSETLYALLNPNNSAATPSYAASGQQAYVWGWKVEQASSASAYLSPMLVSMAANVPSVEPEGLLVEGASTNVCTQSQTFDNAAWTKSTVTVTADQAIAPDGTLTADTLAFASGASLITGTNAVASAAIYSASVYLAPVSGSGKINLIIRDVTAGTDLATYTGSALNAGWQRISVTLPSNAVAGNNLAVRLTCTAAVTAYAWGAQLEVVSSTTGVATSYVPTVAASATRTADAVSIANPLTASAFALAATMTPPGVWTDSTNGLGLGVQFTNNSAYFYTSGSGLGLGVTDNAGGFKAYEMANGLAPGSTHRIAFANSGGLTTAYLDGTAMSTTPGGTGTNTITTQPATFILANGASFGTSGYRFHSIKLGTTIGSVK